MNKDQKSILVHKLHKHIKGELKGKKIAVWGLAFKPQTDDMREAPSRVLIKALLEEGAEVHAYDPVAMPEAKRIFGDNIIYGATPYEVLQDADALLLVTEWAEFKFPDFEKIKQLMTTPLIIDGRNVYDACEMTDKGFVYEGIGV